MFSVRSNITSTTTRMKAGLTFSLPPSSSFSSSMLLQAMRLDGNGRAQLQVNTFSAAVQEATFLATAGVRINMSMNKNRRSIYGYNHYHCCNQNQNQLNIIPQQTQQHQKQQKQFLHVDSQITSTTSSRRKRPSLPVIGAAVAAAAVSSLLAYCLIDKKYLLTDMDVDNDNDNEDKKKKKNLRPPQQFGSSIPYNLLLERNNNNNIKTSSSSSISSQRRSFFSGPSRIDRDRDRDRERARDMGDKVTSITTNDDNNANTNINIDGDGKRNKNRSECAICKKYSRGPCGALFIQWLDCIDEHGDKSEESQSLCDKFIPPLNECLKEHQDYYDKINVYDDDDDDNDDDNNYDDYSNDKDENQKDKHDKMTTRRAKKWQEFILELESQSKSQSQLEQANKNENKNDNENGINIFETMPFPRGTSPEMQIRMDRHVGIAEFHRTIFTQLPKDEDNNILSSSSSLILLLAYIKDQNGTILAAASADELINDIDDDDEGEICVLRFHTKDDTNDVIACGLYSTISSTGMSSDKHHEKSTTTENTNELYYIYRKVERLPPS